MVKVTWIRRTSENEIVHRMQLNVSVFLSRRNDCLYRLKSVCRDLALQEASIYFGGPEARSWGRGTTRTAQMK